MGVEEGKSRSTSCVTVLDFAIGVGCNLVGLYRGTYDKQIIDQLINQAITIYAMLV